MDGRPSRGRGGSWRRGGRGGHDSDSSGGEHRGRGRGGHHRGRGKRDHYRGRGRGGSALPADFHHRDRDEGDECQEEGEHEEVFSRRKLESNWDRYEASERKEPDDDMPTQRGTDYHILLESAGDSFTQFRFSEEKDWEMDSFAATEMFAGFVDLSALAQTLQQVPLHRRLNLEAELFQVTTPVQLPAMTFAPKQAGLKSTAFTPPSAALNILSRDLKVPMATNPGPRSVSQTSLSAVDQHDDDDGDEELDQLLSLQTPVSGVPGSQSVCVAVEETVAPEEACKEVEPEVMKQKKVKDKDVTPPPSTSVKKEMTEEDLEDWLDSMIS